MVFVSTVAERIADSVADTVNEFSHIDPQIILPSPVNPKLLFVARSSTLNRAEGVIDQDAQTVARKGLVFRNPDPAAKKLEDLFNPYARLAPAWQAFDKNPGRNIMVYKIVDPKFYDYHFVNTRVYHPGVDVTVSAPLGKEYAIFNAEAYPWINGQRQRQKIEPSGISEILRYNYQGTLITKYMNKETYINKISYHEDGVAIRRIDVLPLETAAVQGQASPNKMAIDYLIER